MFLFPSLLCAASRPVHRRWVRVTIACAGTLPPGSASLPKQNLLGGASPAKFMSYRCVACIHPEHGCVLTEPGLLLGSTLSHGRERQERKQKKLGAMELQQGTWSELGDQRGLLEEVACRDLEGGKELGWTDWPVPDAVGCCGQLRVMKSNF